MAWAFAYGSLMGDAVLGRYSARPARLPGFQRAFLHESTRRWGTPERPCPILGLVPGDECWGLAFRSRRRSAARSSARSRNGRPRASVGARRGPPRPRKEPWTRGCGSRVRQNGEGRADLDALEARLRSAHGVVGTGVEYVRTVVHAMERHGIQDPLVATLWTRLRG